MGVFEIIYIVLIVVAVVLAVVFQPKPPKPRDPSINDISVPLASESRPIPVCFGRNWIRGPNVVWYGDLKTDPIHSEGGKK